MGQQQSHKGCGQKCHCGDEDSDDDEDLLRSDQKRAKDPDSQVDPSTLVYYEYAPPLTVAQQSPAPPPPKPVQELGAVQAGENGQARLVEREHMHIHKTVQHRHHSQGAANAAAASAPASPGGGVQEGSKASAAPAQGKLTTTPWYTYPNLSRGFVGKPPAPQQPQAAAKAAAAAPDQYTYPQLSQGVVGAPPMPQSKAPAGPPPLPAQYTYPQLSHGFVGAPPVPQ